MLRLRGEVVIGFALACLAASCVWWFASSSEVAPQSTDPSPGKHSLQEDSRPSSLSPDDSSGPTDREQIDVPDFVVPSPETQTQRDPDEPTIVIVVRVVDPSGVPAPDMPVHAQGTMHYASDGSPLRTDPFADQIGRTNSDGMVTATLPVNDYMITAMGYETPWSTEHARFESKSPPRDHVQIIVYPRTSTLRLRVVDDAHQPIAEAKASVFNLDTATTDATGLAVLEKLPSGRPVTVEVSGAPIPANVRRLKREKFAITLQPGSNEHTLVVQRRGNLIVRAGPLVLDRIGDSGTVTVVLNGRPHYVSRNTPEISFRREAGITTLHTSGPEPLRLKATHEIEIQPGVKRVWTIEHLPGECTVEGQVTDQSGYAIQGVQVEVRFASEDRQPAQIRTNAEGRFHFPELPSEPLVVAILPDLEVATHALRNGDAGERVVKWQSSTRIATVNFTVESGYAIYGRILRSGKADTQSAAFIVLEGPRPTGNTLTVHSYPSGNRWIKPGGYMIGNLRAGAYTLRLKGGDGPATEIVLGPGLPGNTASHDLARK